MKKSGILNPSILGLVGKLGHRDMVAVTDRGFPLASDPEITTVDVSVVANLPSVLDVAIPLSREIIVEEVIFATETARENSAFLEKIRSELPGIPETSISHAEFKKLVLGLDTETSIQPTDRMIGQIRTGEFTPYTNVVFVCGVSF